MKINAITQNYNQITFNGKRHKQNKSYNTSFSNSIVGLDMPCFYEGVYGVQQSGSKKVKSNNIGCFDFDELMAIKPKESVEAKALSFADSHAKFKLDKYQQEAIDAYNSGKTTIVSAPTGTGKTLIAEHVIQESLNKGKKWLIYTI